MKSMEYLESFLEKAKEILPDWMVEEIHDQAVPKSGGYAKSNRLEEKEIEKMVKGLKELIEKEVVDFQDLALADRDMGWDGEQAEENIREWASDGEVNKENMNWDEYRTGFLWYDPENEENFGAYKFPIADVVNGELRAVPRGIFMAAGALSGARLEGGARELDLPREDIEDMKNHLSNYYEKMAEEFEDESIVAPWEEEEVEGTKKSKRFEVNSNIMKAEHEKQLVYGVVLEPEQVDAQGDMISKKEIEKTAHFFLLNSQVVGDSHRKEASAKIAESYIAPVDFELNGQLVKQGSWVLVTKVLDDKLWKDIKSGKYNSYSVGGYGKREEVRRSK